MVTKKFVVEIELGNAAMQTRDDVRNAIHEALDKPGRHDPMDGYDRGTVRDLNGNKVGTWHVMSLREGIVDPLGH